MPRAVSDKGYSEQFPLKSCPPDGFVELRKMDYGENLTRRQMTMRMYMQKGDEDINFEMLQRDIQVFDFQKSIVDHNLEDVDNRKLDFRSKNDILKLDTPIALEIEDLINKFNGRDSSIAESAIGMGDESGNLSLQSGMQSTEEESTQS